MIAGIWSYLLQNAICMVASSELQRRLCTASSTNLIVLGQHLRPRFCRQTTGLEQHADRLQTIVPLTLVTAEQDYDISKISRI